jgi:MFS family permease
VVGGTGNGVQWVALITTVQELTRATYQARVLSLVEAVASAMPGLGFLLGGAVTALLNPRAAYAIAGSGVLVVLALAVVRLHRVEWRRELVAGEAEAAVQAGFAGGQPAD